MKGTIPLGRFAGIPLGAHWSVLAMVGLVAQIMALVVLPETAPHYPAAAYWAVGVGTAVLFVVSLLVHELAHALVARHYKVRVERITLWLLGGVSQLATEAPTPRAELLIAGSGPMASVAIGGLFAGVSAAGTALRFPTLALAGMVWLAVANLALAVFNLLPGAPLDGGRVLRAALWKRSGDRDRASARAAQVGRILGALLLAAGFVQALVSNVLGGLWLALVGWFLVGAATAEQSSFAVHRKLAGVLVRDVMTQEPVVAPSWWTVDAFLDRVGRQEHHRAFPVIDFDGRPFGVVNLSDLARLARDSRAVTRVADACQPLGEVPVAAPSDQLAELIATTRLRLRHGRDLILVVENGRLVGVVSPADIARTIELAALQQAPLHPFGHGAASTDPAGGQRPLTGP
jgi:Zn-dependent protease/CBS domain-containing protein